MDADKVCVPVNLLELVGVIMGDGCLIYRPDKRVYTLETSGNVEEEFEYYQQISSFLEGLTGSYSLISVRHHWLCKSLRLQFHSMSFLEFLRDEFQLTSPKSFTVSIPEKYQE